MGERLGSWLPPPWAPSDCALRYPFDAAPFGGCTLCVYVSPPIPTADLVHRWCLMKAESKNRAGRGDSSLVVWLLVGYELVRQETAPSRMLFGLGFSFEGGSCYEAWLAWSPL